MRSRLLLLILASALARAQDPARQALEQAAEEFRKLTRDMGLRPDSPKRAARARAAGGSAWHGRLYHNLRNDILDAVPHEIRQRGGTKNLLRRNQFGFSVSGPLVVPRLYDGARRTFFSLNYEGVRERIARSSLRTVAIEPERRGDFSLTVDQSGAPLPIYDPATVRPNPAYNPALPVSADNLEYLKDPFPPTASPTPARIPSPGKRWTTTRCPTPTPARSSATTTSSSRRRPTPPTA